MGPRAEEECRPPSNTRKSRSRYRKVPAQNNQCLAPMSFNLGLWYIGAGKEDGEPKTATADTVATVPATLILHGRPCSCAAAQTAADAKALVPEQRWKSDCSIRTGWKHHAGQCASQTALDQDRGLGRANPAARTRPRRPRTRARTRAGNTENNAPKA